jgi:hypothetical protein
MLPSDLAKSVQRAIDTGDLNQARSLIFYWLNQWLASLSKNPTLAELRQPELWRCLADVVERTSDQYLIEKMWQILDNLPPPRQAEPDCIPLIGIPILNGIEYLERLLESIDCPINTLAIVDNSIVNGSLSDLSNRLDAIRQLGHPMIQEIHIARPFKNIGVAASWNLILSSFPTAAIALITNHDVTFHPGVLQQAIERMDCSKPQFLSLLPNPNSFSSFFITALAWDQVGLFDPGFHPAYFEDLDYRDRIRSNPSIDWISGEFAHASMAAANTSHSATIMSNPNLYKENQATFQLNRIWYLSHRRLQGNPRGTWRRLWLSQWENRTDEIDPFYKTKPHA